MAFICLQLLAFQSFLVLQTSNAYDRDCSLSCNCIHYVPINCALCLFAPMYELANCSTLRIHKQEFIKDF